MLRALPSEKQRHDGYGYQQRGMVHLNRHMKFSSKRNVKRQVRVYMRKRYAKVGCRVGEAMQGRDSGVSSLGHEM